MRGAETKNSVAGEGPRQRPRCGAPSASLSGDSDAIGIGKGRAAAVSKAAQILGDCLPDAERVINSVDATEA